MYATVLNRAGHKVEIVEDGRDALRVAQSKKFELIILDMLLKEMNGLDFLRSFNGQKDHPETKIVVMSNIENPKIVKEAMALGVKKYLIKAAFTPIEIGTLVDAVLAGKE
jgi:PleD family two-component response regulator